MIFLYQYIKVIVLFTESLFLSLIFVTSEGFTSVFFIFLSLLRGFFFVCDSFVTFKHNEFISLTAAYA